MDATKVILQFADGTPSNEIWALVKTLQAANVFKSPIVVGKFHYAAGIVDTDEDALSLLMAAARSKLRVEFRFE